jgi:hypothetical protein
MSGAADLRRIAGEAFRDAEQRRDRRETKTKQHTAGNGKSDLPIIAVTAGKRHEAADAGLAALSRALIYQRGTAMVRCATVQAKNSSQTEVVHTPGIVTITQPYLERELGMAAGWNRPTKTGKPRFIDPPHDVAAQILAMQGEWPFPVLSGVIGTQTMRPDGTLLLAEGYDWQTGYYLLSPPRMPGILDHPSKADAQRGLELLDDLIGEFPFVDEPSKSVALSAIMTPVLRAAMQAAPCHAATAPVAGSGKSFLFDTCAMVATGDLCPVVSVSKGNVEEREKRLIGCALSGHLPGQYDGAVGRRLPLPTDRATETAAEGTWIVRNGGDPELVHRLRQRPKPRGGRGHGSTAHDPGRA